MSEQELAAAYEQALDAYRADPSEDNKDAYQAAAKALRERRAADRAGRVGMGVNSDVEG